jgi:hypothetical protein
MRRSPGHTGTFGPSGRPHLIRTVSTWIDGHRHVTWLVASDEGGGWRDPERIWGWAADVVMELVSLDQLGQLHA